MCPSNVIRYSSTFPANYYSRYMPNGVVMSAKAVGAVGRPADVAIFTEINITNYPNLIATRPGANADDFGPGLGEDKLHNGGMNVGFADGHARYAKASTLTYRNYGANPIAGKTLDSAVLSGGTTTSPYLGD